MARTTEQNKRLVLEAFDTLFNKRYYAAGEKFWSPHFGQEPSAVAQVRTGDDCGRRRLRDCSRTIFRFSAGELDCG